MILTKAEYAALEAFNGRQINISGKLAKKLLLIHKIDYAKQKLRKLNKTH